MVLAGSALAPAGGAEGVAPTITPYRLGGALPPQVSSPPVDPRAPYTPLVRSLIRQLLPHATPTRAELVNANRLFEGHLGSAVDSCAVVGSVLAPAGTRPGIGPLCWADAVGINLVTGPNRGTATASAQPLALAASFDVALNNAWGQVEGLEGRQTAVTGLYGPEVDVAIQADWQRGGDTLGEDPFLAGILGAAQVHGMQGRGLMAQVKHLAGFSGAHRFAVTEVPDQALHEIVLAPFEEAVARAGAASVMCAYESLHDTSTHLPRPGPLVFTPSPYGDADGATTWPLDEAHQSCEQPLTLDHVLRRLWGSLAFVGSDYPAVYSTSAAAQGVHQEFPSAVFLGSGPVPATAGPGMVTTADDPMGNTCAIDGRSVPCSRPGARHVGGIPGPGCPEATGCGLVDAVLNGTFPLAVYKQMMALVLYQHERFGLLGCDDSPRARTCTNPGGVRGDRSGAAPLPEGPVGADGRDVGTVRGDAAIAERTAEEGAVLLKNSGDALPLTTADVRRGIAVSGFGAEHLIGSPSNEHAVGRADRQAVSPLQQLRALAGGAGHIAYTPALSVTGTALGPHDLTAHRRPGLHRDAGPGAGRVDGTIDFTRVSPRGRLGPGVYRWSGVLHVPRADTYTLRVQQSAVPGDARDEARPATVATVAVDGVDRPLRSAASPYCGQYYQRFVCVPVSRTTHGTTASGLANQQADPIRLRAGDHRIELTFTNATDGPASFRVAADRAAGDAELAAEAARGKAAAVVFVDDRSSVTVGDDSDHPTPPDHRISTLAPAAVRLIKAVAAANPRTIVVLNTATPVIVTPWADDPHVRAILQMWNAGSEGGTATARLLLGHVSPSGHTPITWPRRSTDTLSALDQKRALHPGDRAGVHPERLNGAPDPVQAHCDQNPLQSPKPCTKTVLSQGIFSGYRFFDQLGVRPRYPFGFGLSYTTFRYSDLRLRWDGPRLRATVTVTNTGRRAADAVPQLYLGPGRRLPGVQQAPRSLIGFDRVHIAAGRSRRVGVTVARRAFQHWSETRQAWRTTPGVRRIWAGSAADPALLPVSGSVDAIRRTVVGASAEDRSPGSSVLAWIPIASVPVLVAALLVLGGLRARRRIRHT